MVSPRFPQRIAALFRRDPDWFVFAVALDLLAIVLWLNNLGVIE